MFLSVALFPHQNILRFNCLHSTRNGPRPQVPIRSEPSCVKGLSSTSTPPLLGSHCSHSHRFPQTSTVSSLSTQEPPALTLCTKEASGDISPHPNVHPVQRQLQITATLMEANNCKNKYEQETEQLQAAPSAGLTLCHKGHSGSNDQLD